MVLGSEIDEHLNTAHAILLLISADFLASDYCYDIEMKRAMERHERRETRVIPIILRAVDNWQATPFGKLKALPTDGKPITSWQNRDEAFADVARGIRLAIAELAASAVSVDLNILVGTPPRVWNVPHERNPNFAGREELLAELRASLTSEQAAAPNYAVSGLGGAGKTQLAVEYAYRYATEYNLVWWVPSEEPAMLAATYASLAQELSLELPDTAEQPAIVQAVRQWLEHNPGWLLVFDNAGGPEDLHDYLPRDAVGHVLVTSRNPGWRAVARTAAMRRLIDAAPRISAIGYDDTDDVEATLRQAEILPFSARTGQTERGFIPLRQVYDQYLEERAAVVEPLSQRQGPVMVGYGDLDELLGGLQPSDMIILGARPALGKSTLALNVSLNAAKDGATVGIFSLEMSREQLALRVLTADAEVDSHRLRLGLYTEAEEQRIIDSLGQLSELAVYIDDTPLQGMVEMFNKASRLSLEHGLDLLVVDYLQLIQGRGRGDNRVQEISEISRSLKGMARELRVPLIICSQLSRTVENRPGHRPQLSDLRNSGSIEQDSDVVIFIHREDVYYCEDEWDEQFPGRPYPKNIAEIIVAKHRNGPTGSVKLRFRANLVRFDPVKAES
jgi:replicative DNA helicase